MEDNEIEDIEIDCLLEAISRCHGYEFRGYARASLKRRILNRMTQQGLTRISEMIPNILYDNESFDHFLTDMSISVTEMFRDPIVFKSIREAIIPKLKSYPRINVWHAGCATGEEPYSMAILLAEEGIISKARIYATDFNNKSLAKAEKGVYPIDGIQKFTRNYIKAGGKKSFADYYSAKYNSAKMKESLKNVITFANHNLMGDKVFAETHLVLCRNVLIYFKQSLQNQVLALIRDSLVNRGFLVLGDKETLQFSIVENDFEVFDKKMRIYRKKRNV